MKALTCGWLESCKLTNQRNAPAESSIRHRKQEQPSLNDLSAVSSENDSSQMVKSTGEVKKTIETEN